MLVPKNNAQFYNPATTILTKANASKTSPLEKSTCNTLSLSINAQDAEVLRRTGLWNRLMQQNQQLHFHIIPNKNKWPEETNTDHPEAIQKHQVFTHIAHEINTPLAGITGVVHLLECDPDPEILDMEMLTLLKKSVYRINHTVANILLFEQLRHDQLVCKEESVENACALINNTITQIAQQHNRSADINMSNLPDCRVNIPQHMLTKSIEEIITNAITYSGPNTPINIKAHCTAGYLHLCIQDHGRGFTQAQINQISAYKQFNREFHEQQGLGLGIHLTRLIVQKYGGNMHITSSPEKGTSVYLTFPR